MFEKIAPPLTVLFLLGFISCASFDTELQEDWPEEYFFKTAQQASDRGNLRESLFYYDVYLLRYPQNHTKGIAAEYERAFLFYKMKDYDQAELYFDAILQKYESDPYAYLYPKAYKVLSEKVVAAIEENRVIDALPLFQRGKARRHGLESLEESEES